MSLPAQAALTDYIDGGMIGGDTYRDPGAKGKPDTDSHCAYDEDPTVNATMEVYYDSGSGAYGYQQGVQFACSYVSAGSGAVPHCRASVSLGAGLCSYTWG